MEYYAAIKGNEVLIPETLWVNQENIILSESSQTPKATRWMAGGRQVAGGAGIAVITPPLLNCVLRFYSVVRKVYVPNMVSFM